MTPPISLVLAASSFSAGILGAKFAPVPALPALGLILASALLTVVLAGRRPQLTPWLIGLFFMAAGAFHASLALAPRLDANDIATLAQERQEMTLTGILSASPAIAPQRSTLLMEVRARVDDQGVSPAHGRIQLSLAEPPPAGLAPGDPFIVRVQVGPVPSHGVPGAFNYQEYMAYQGIRASGWIRSPALLREIRPLPPPSWLESLRYQPERLRARLSRLLANSQPPPIAGIYQAILLGEQANLSPEILESFKASGSVHILSISGLHMALVSLCTTLLLSFLLRRSTWVLTHLPATKVAALLSLLPLTLYAMIAGFNPPVVRSLLMVGVFILALLADRQASLGTNIAIAALLQLAATPLLLFTASFQLTFAAVISIALAAPLVLRLTHTPLIDSPEIGPATRAWRSVRAWGLASLLVSVAVTLGTAPILAWQFNRVPLLSPLATLLIEPFLCLWSLILGLFACLLSAWPGLAQALLDLGSPGITISVAIADFFARLPWGSLWVATPPLTVVILWYVVLLVLIYGRLSRPRLALVLAPCLGLGLALFFLRPPAPAYPPTTRLTVLDVGQGSAMVIEMPDGAIIVVDGGRKRWAAASSPDVGETLIAPFLWHKRISRIAAIVCSHPDADHYSGIPFLLRRFSPTALWINDPRAPDEGYRAMLDLAKTLDIAIHVPKTGEILHQAGEARLIALSGAPNKGTTEKDSANDQSLVLRLVHGDIAFLLPSDIERGGEEKLVERGGLGSDVLVAPHHGSHTSSSAAFVTAVRPRYVAISAGHNQRDYFPAPEVVERYARQGGTVLETATLGSIFFRTDGREIGVESHATVHLEP